MFLEYVRTRSPIRVRGHNAAQDWSLSRMELLSVVGRLFVRIDSRTDTVLVPIENVAQLRPKPGVKAEHASDTTPTDPGNTRRRTRRSRD